MLPEWPTHRHTPRIRTHDSSPAGHRAGLEAKALGWPLSANVPPSSPDPTPEVEGRCPHLCSAWREVRIKLITSDRPGLPLDT